MLPVPSNLPPAESAPKKSHARKQPPGHVPRPRNAFILFRCDFVQQKRVPESVEHDHRNISRIAGSIWREMSNAEKAPWLAMAEREKSAHAQMYPAYRYTPSEGAAGGIFVRKKKGKGQEVEAVRPATDPTEAELAARRSYSCPPPGSIALVPASVIPPYADKPAVKDDLARRPSRTTMYHTVTSPDENSSFTLPEEPTYPRSHGPHGPLLISSAYGNIAPPTGTSGWEEVNDPYPILSQEEQESLNRFGHIYDDGYELPTLDWGSTAPFPNFTNPFAEGYTYSPPIPIPAAPTISPLESLRDARGTRHPYTTPLHSVNSSSRRIVPGDAHLPQLPKSNVDISLLFPRLSLDNKT